ncbi:MAG: hypothetical protein KC912_16805 [Proteobacteria bacterium]|nr:hypothetical protein [Pseudomonadota bacterium]
MRRLVLGVVAFGVSAAGAWAASATSAVAEWRADISNRSPLTAAERLDLVQCQNPGADALGRVIAQDMRVDCDAASLLDWFVAHRASDRVQRALLVPTVHPRHEVWRAGPTAIDGDGRLLSTALEHPDLMADERNALLIWVSLQPDLPVLHPRTAEQVARLRFEREGWLPHPHVLLRGAERAEGVDWEQWRTLLEREHDVALACTSSCRDAVLKELERVSELPVVDIPPALAGWTSARVAEETAEMLDEAALWVREDPARSQRLVRRGNGHDSASALRDGGSEALAAWTALEVSRRAGAAAGAIRSSTGVDVGEVHFDVCAGSGHAAVEDLAELVRPRQPAHERAGTAVEAAGRLLSDLSRQTTGVCTRQDSEI